MWNLKYKTNKWKCKQKNKLLGPRLNQSSIFSPHPFTSQFPHLHLVVLAQHFRAIILPPHQPGNSLASLSFSDKTPPGTPAPYSEAPDVGLALPSWGLSAQKDWPAPLWNGWAEGDHPHAHLWQPAHKYFKREGLLFSDLSIISSGFVTEPAIWDGGGLQRWSESQWTMACGFLKPHTLWVSKTTHTWDKAQGKQGLSEVGLGICILRKLPKKFDAQSELKATDAGDPAF